MHAVLWRELPYPDADRLVLVDADARGVSSAGLASAEASDLRDEPALFDALATIASVDAHVTSGDDWERVPAASANDDALRLLGALPLTHGRVLEGARDGGVDSVVRAIVISHQLWQRRFHGDATIIGRHVEVNNLDVEIVGVLRPDFRVYLPASAALPEVVDVWFPRGFDPDRRNRNQGTIARLASGVSVDAAERRLEVIAQRAIADHSADYPDRSLRLSVRSLHDVLTANVRPALRVLAGAVFVVLLIGCVNVGNLMLARARARAAEMAVRRALGATRARLLAELFAETAILTGAGAVAGFLLAYGGIGAVEWRRPAHLPRQSQISINAAVALYTAALAVMVSIVFGLVPALGQRWKNGHAPLRAGRANVQRSGTRRLQRTLVIAEVALSIVPLVAAGLMLRTFVNLANASIGFAPDGVQTAKIAFSFRLLPDIKQRLQLHVEAIDRVSRIPGVESVSLGSPIPFDEVQFTRTYGRAEENAMLQSRATVQTVFPGYLGTTGTRLRSGRHFTTDDLVNQRPVVIVDERIANQLWPDGAVGHRLAVTIGRSPVPLEVIGVTNAVRVTRVSDESMPHIFVPYHCFPIEMAVVAKTPASAATIGPEVKRRIESLGTRRPVYDIMPMRNYVEHSMGDTRFTMLVLSAFAISAVLLAAIGLYGTLAYLTSQRRQEFGIRMALGASATRIMRAVAGEGLALAAIGAALGFAGAAAVTGALRGLLYNVTPFDSVTLLTVASVVGVSAVIAAGHPAWRASQVDPSSALRTE